MHLYVGTYVISKYICRLIKNTEHEKNYSTSIGPCGIDRYILR